jgi:competence protein ComEC
MNLHPLVIPAVAYVLGVLASHWLGLPPWPLLIAAVVTGAFLILWAMRRRALSVWGLTLLCLLLGAGLLGWERSGELQEDHVRHLVAMRPKTLIADVMAAPERTQHGWRLLVESRKVEGKPVQGLVRLSMGESKSPPLVGQRIAALVRLKPVTSFANPGGFDYASFLALQGIHVAAYAGKRAGLRVLGPGRIGFLRKGLEKLRERLSLGLESLPPGPSRGLLRALILGQRGELGGDVREAFGATGTAHLLAISGLHMGFVWGFCFLVLRLALAAWPGLALRYNIIKLAAAGALLPCLGYALLAGSSTPTLRALIMAVCLVAALMADRPYRPSGGLALAALVIGIIWPEAPLTLSFQLSFVAVASILLAAGPLVRWIKGKQNISKVKGNLLGWLALSAVVGIAVWPLTVLYFHQLPFLSLLANALLVPLVGLVTLPLALLGAALSLFWLGGGEVIWWLALGPAWLALGLVRIMAAIPGAVHYLAGPGPWAVMLMYTAAFVGLILRQHWRWLALGPLLASMMLWAGHGPQPPDGKLNAWVLDVGQGSAAVVRLPQGQVIVVDGGGWPTGDFDFGKRVIAPFLWAQGFDHVQIVVASHAHPDHTGGLAFIVRWFEPREVWTNGSFSRVKSYLRLLKAADDIGVPIKGPDSLPKEMNLGGAMIKFLWPPDPPRPGEDENSNSLWLGFGLGSSWLWLPGDNDAKVERELASHLPVGGWQVLAAPHHGGVGSLSRKLMMRLKPQAVVFSSGCGNSYRVPKPGPLSRARAYASSIFRTDRQGAIHLVADGGAWQISPFLNPPRDCPAR